MREQKIINCISNLECSYGIGDDCFTINQNNIISTDSFVEGVHFLCDKMTAKQIAHKAATSAVSDVAAMGGIPEFILISISLPRNIRDEWVMDFFAGIEESAQRYSYRLSGGDITSSMSDIFINMTVYGKCKYNTIPRSGAQIEDMICVTGNLGDSKAGLELLMNSQSQYSISEQILIDQHINPKARTDISEDISQIATSMIDISDGLFASISSIMQQSHCGAEIQIENIPISKALFHYSKNYQDIAISGGEDYELLFTTSYQKLHNIQKSLKDQILIIGRIVHSGLKFSLRDKEYTPILNIFNH